MGFRSRSREKKTDSAALVIIDSYANTVCAFQKELTQYTLMCVQEHIYKHNESRLRKKQPVVFNLRVYSRKTDSLRFAHNNDETQP